MFRKKPPVVSSSPPEQFRWMAVRMDLTSWGVISALTLIGLGVWTAGIKIIDLSFTVEKHDKSINGADKIDETQNQRIQNLEITLARQQGYLEQILQAVRRDHDPTQYQYKP